MWQRLVLLGWVLLLAGWPGVGAFLVPPKGTRPVATTTTAPKSVQVAADNNPPCLILSMKKTSNNPQKNDNNNSNKGDVWDTMRAKPGMMFVWPLVFLVGVDLLLNMAVLVKRSIDYAVFHQAPSTETWW